ncbi:MAG TPA: ankyrin repeat domain-containing protein, partial [Pyrinomonadaceae bacterium]|nr:ankyrin repeat domain-containing protein [Pyrinomonadaceae bacterium]
MSATISLTSAVTSGDERAVSALLANGADVNETSSGGRTPLILAVIYGHTNIVQRLVQAGADPQQRDSLGLNAVEWAHRRGLREALDVLTNPQRANTPPKKIVINFEEPEPEAPEVKPVAPKPEVRDSVVEDDKSRRWIAGLKQRLDEQELRRLNRNEPPAEVRSTKIPEPE